MVESNPRAVVRRMAEADVTDYAMAALIIELSPLIGLARNLNVYGGVRAYLVLDGKRLGQLEEINLVIDAARYAARHLKGDQVRVSRARRYESVGKIKAALALLKMMLADEVKQPAPPQLPKTSY